MSDHHEMNKNQPITDKKIYLISGLLAVLPLSFSLPIHSKALPIGIAFFVGLLLIIKNKKIRASMAAGRSVLLPLLFVPAADVINFIAHHLSIANFDLPSHTFIFMAIGALFALPLHDRLVNLGFSLTGAFLGIVSIVQHYFLYISRPYGLNNGNWGAIEFAMFSLVLGLIGVNQLLQKENPPWLRAIHLICAILAALGAILTQSRGPILASLICLILLFALQIYLYRRWKLVCGIMLCLALGAIVFITQAEHSFISRLTSISTEIETYNSKNNSQGSVRERLEMWRTAKHAFLSHPWLGIGFNQFGVYIQEEIASGQSNPSIEGYSHTHNEYLEAAATGGILGLLTCLLQFIAPGLYFLRQIINKTNVNEAVQGSIVIIMYALCALTDNVMYRAMPQSLFLFLVIGYGIRSKLSFRRSLLSATARGS